MTPGLIQPPGLGPGVVLGPQAMPAFSVFVLSVEPCLGISGLACVP